MGRRQRNWDMVRGNRVRTMSLRRSGNCAEKGLGKEQNCSIRNAEGTQSALPFRACFPKHSSQKRLGGKEIVYFVVMMMVIAHLFHNHTLQKGEENF